MTFTGTCTYVPRCGTPYSESATALSNSLICPEALSLSYILFLKACKWKKSSLLAERIKRHTSEVSEK